MTDVCRLVYVCGDDVNVQNRDDCTPLHRAIGFANADVVGALLLAEADEIIANDWGKDTCTRGYQGKK